MPFEVLHSATLARLEASGRWYAIHENYEGNEALTCRQAVTIRHRLGSGEFGGTPLWSELKTEMGVARNTRDGREVPYAAHTRANTMLDAERLAAALGLVGPGWVFQMRGKGYSDELSEQERGKESRFVGLVNPLNIDQLFACRGRLVDPADIHQIFDSSVTLYGGRPDTVLTNAGVRTHAFEMRPADLIAGTHRVFPKTEIADVAAPDPIWLGTGGQHRREEEWLRFPPPGGPKIGILTGNSPESGMILWRDILKTYRSAFDNTADVLMPEVVVYSLPAMGLSMELRSREAVVWQAIEGAIGELLGAGCRLVTVACNTTIHFADRIRKLCAPQAAEFLSIAEACVPSIERELEVLSPGDSRVGLVGIGPVIDFSGGFSGYAAAFLGRGLEVVPCEGTELAYLMKSRDIETAGGGKASAQLKNLLTRQLGDVPVVVLALTEVSLAFRRFARKGLGTDQVFIDPVLELARAVVSRYLHRGLLESEVCQLPHDFDVRTGIERRIRPEPVEMK